MGENCAKIKIVRDDDISMLSSPIKNLPYRMLSAYRPATNEHSQIRLLEESSPRQARGSCQEEASRDWKNYFSFLAPPRRVLKSLHDIFALKVGIKLQNLLNTVICSYHADDHPHGHSHPTNAGAATHD
jgi:hypothetical protein